MQRIVLSVMLALAASSAFAARPSTLGMSCRQAQGFVANEGAVVMSTGTHTYDRFVVSIGFCATGEYAYTGFAPTTDAPQCVVGYVCKPHPPLFADDDDDFLFGR